MQMILTVLYQAILNSLSAWVRKAHLLAFGFTGKSIRKIETNGDWPPAPEHR